MGFNLLTLTEMGQNREEEHFNSTPVSILECNSEIFRKEHIHPDPISYLNLCLCLIQMPCENQMTSISPADAPVSHQSTCV